MQSQISQCLQHWVLTWGFADMECPSTICLSTKIPVSQFIVFPPLLFFQSNHIVCFYNKDSGQSSPKVKGKVPHVFDKPWKTLYFLHSSHSCNAMYYENWPHSVKVVQNFLLWSFFLPCLVCNYLKFSITSASV